MTPRNNRIDSHFRASVTGNNYRNRIIDTATPPINNLENPIKNVRLDAVHNAIYYDEEYLKYIKKIKKNFSNSDNNLIITPHNRNGINAIDSGRKHKIRCNEDNALITTTQLGDLSINQNLSTSSSISSTTSSSTATSITASDNSEKKYINYDNAITAIPQIQNLRINRIKENYQSNLCMDYINKRIEQAATNLINNNIKNTIRNNNIPHINNLPVTTHNGNNGNTIIIDTKITNPDVTNLF
jgi:hypothetical protein